MTIYRRSTSPAIPVRQHIFASGFRMVYVNHSIDFFIMFHWKDLGIYIYYTYLVSNYKFNVFIIVSLFYLCIINEFKIKLSVRSYAG